MSKEEEIVKELGLDPDRVKVDYIEPGEVTTDAVMAAVSCQHCNSSIHEAKAVGKNLVVVIEHEDTCPFFEQLDPL